MSVFPIKNELTLMVSKNHYNNYETRVVKTVPELLKLLVRYCVCPVSALDDEERVGSDGKMYLSKNHRANRNITSRGCLAIIDFEGLEKHYKKLLKLMKKNNIWFISIPSQSNLSDSSNRRAHIVYLLKKPYSINKDAFKEQVKGFFNHIGYKWDEPDSGIDVVATFNASGYFSPTFQLPSDAKTKVLKTPYTSMEMIEKDIDVNIDKNAKAYKPIKVSSNEANPKTASAEAKKDEKLSKSNFNDHLLFISKNSLMVQPTLSIPIASGGYTSMEILREELLSMDGEKPMISGLGCPECSDIHSGDPAKTRYAFAGLDDERKIYVFCGGSHNQTYRANDGPVSIWRTIKLNTGAPLYIILDEYSKVHYTDDSVGTVIFNAPSCSDELHSRFNMGEYDEYGNYSRAKTIGKHILEVPSIQLQYHPFHKSGLDARSGIYNLVKEPKYIPRPEEANEIVLLALGGFQNDVNWKGIPIGVIYLSYYLFHTKKIMAILFLVHPKRKIGKSTWVLDIPKWYLSRCWSMMDNQAIENAWDDAKLGVRGLCYEDIENQDSRVKRRLAADLKSEATGGEYKLLNIKGQGQVRSFGHNVVGTTNHRDQIPLDGQHDRRIHIVEFNPVNDKRLLGAFDLNRSGEVNLQNAINYLFGVYKECEEKKDDKLYNYLYTETPQTDVKDETASNNLLIGAQIGSALTSSTTKKELEEALKPLVSIGNDWEMVSLKDWVNSLDFKSKGHLDITDKQLLTLYQMTPNGGQNGKEYTSNTLIKILGLQDLYPSGFRQLKINGKKAVGIKLTGYIN